MPPSLSPAEPVARPKSSPLMLCDHLIALAQEAERAGYASTAARLVVLAESMFLERPRNRRDQSS